jgi:hypothetical protein
MLACMCLSMAMEARHHRRPAHRAGYASCGAGVSFAVRGRCVDDGRSGEARRCSCSPFPHQRVRSQNCVLGDRGRRDWLCSGVIGWSIPQQNSAAFAISAAIRPRAVEPRARLALVDAESVAVGWKLCRCCDTGGFPGASQYMGETGVISKACQSNSLGCQAQRHSATNSSWRFETATLRCTESLESISSVRSRFMHIEQ